MSNYIWFEKYRPKNLEDMVLSDSLYTTFNIYIQNQDIPHLLFYGPPGSGKTTISKILIDGIPCSVLSLNASSKDRGIDTVKGKIKDFASSQIEYGKKIKIVFLDEADGFCLTGETEIIVGSLESPRVIKIKDLPLLKNPHKLNGAENVKIGKEIKIPSFNTETRGMENDKGYLLDSGETIFYEIELEDGSIIEASANHPFFNKELKEIKVKDLNVGDSIVSLEDEIYKECPICKNKTFNQKFCSISCANKSHSQSMTGKNNPNFGKKAWNNGLSKDTDKRVAKQACYGEINK